MVLINKDVSIRDKSQIIISALLKIFRGLLKKVFLRHSKGFLFVGRHVTLKNKQYISVGKNVKFEDYSEIQGLSSHGIKFGNNVTIGSNVMIRPSSYYGVGHIGYGLEMGDNSSIGPDGFIGCAGKVQIGKNVMIGPRSMLIAENHIFSDSNRLIKEQGVVQKGIIIGNNVWIGANVTILDGVVINSGAVIGAGTLVNHSVDKNKILVNKRSINLKNR